MSSINYHIGNICKALLLSLLCGLFVDAYAQDLPPAVANLETIGEGSYIIPLDEEKQSIPMTNEWVDIDFVGFNVAAYGLAYHILEGGIPVKWVVRTGKEKDEIDFTVNARQLFPVENVMAEYDFISGAFVVDIADLAIVDCESEGNITALLDGIIEDFGRDVTVYELGETIDLDVRHHLTYPPTIAVLNDGFSSYVHVELLQEAGIPFELISSQVFFDDYSCYTFISQPHLDNINNPNYIPSVQDFVDNGGNFFAQCIAIEPFENGGFFHTDDGVNEIFGDNDTYDYSFGDMALMQFQGDLATDIHGSLYSFNLDGGSDWITNSYIGIVNQNEDIILSAADHNGATLGGNVSYLAGHDFEGSDLEDLSYGGFIPGWIDLDTQLPQNQQHKRIYLNAAFIPANISFACAGADICICPTESVELGCDDLSEIIDYTWSPAEGLSCTDCPHPIASPEVTTTYTITGDNGCTSSSVTVTVEEQYLAAFMSGGGSLACNNQSSTIPINVEFSDDIGEKTFVYALNGEAVDTITTSENSYEILVDQEGEYSLISVVAASINCVDGVLSGTAVVNDSPNINFELGEDMLACFGEVVEIDATYTAYPVSYEWQDGSTDSIFVTTEAGVYAVTITTDEGCSGMDSLQLDFSPELLAPDLGPDQNLCDTPSINLDATTPNAISYLWSDGSTEATNSFNAAGTYWVDVSNECETKRDEIILLTDNLDANAIVFSIPNAFSPNGDGLNDVFRPIPIPDITVESFNFQVFDRWGKQLKVISALGDSWDGEFSGEKMELGVYVWYLEARVRGCTNSDAIDVFRKGNISLIR